MNNNLKNTLVLTCTAIGTLIGFLTGSIVLTTEKGKQINNGMKDSVGDFTKLGKSLANSKLSIK
ncbi:MAG: hypothetical protein IAA81_06030 [Spirochaetes bacterium]|uniref:Uncharacterized protein n=1 Tax=Candidatus Gallitreponema excrementavium TaxID=2840840 RepID=A0A9D9HPC5_9SPIR|nr:hypothetical protein [Candidatus Gallitreponema excrementavium]